MRSLDRLRAGLALAAVVAIGGAFGLGLSACGGDDGDETASTSVPAQAETQPAEGGGKGASGEDGGGAGGGSGGGSPSAKGGEGSGEAVDLTVAPARIEHAVVTSTGAVQTLPPSEEAHRTAQHNSYGSIRAFGEESEGEEATNITFGLLQYLTAKAEADWATACARLYSPLRENLEKLAKEGGGCTEAYGSLMSRVPESRRAEAARIDVSSVRRGEGNRAFVIYKTPDTLSADMPMYVEDGAWRVGAVEAYALTPDQVQP